MHLIASADVKTFILVLLIFVPLERALALHASQAVFRRGWLTDLTFVFVNRPIIEAGLAVLILSIGLAGCALMPYGPREVMANQPLWLQVIQVIFIADLGFYLVHRLFHAVPALWRLHAIHHSIEELDWLAAARVHPIDQILTKGASLLPPFILGYSDSAIALYGLIYFWHSFLLHANVDVSFPVLNVVIASPRFHHWHHATNREARDKNFAGQLSMLDRLFGTLHMPPDRLPAQYGLDEALPGNYVSYLAYPFTKRSGRNRVIPPPSTTAA